MSLILVGLSHRTAPVEVREQLSMRAAEAAELIVAMKTVPGVSGAIVLSTCNRVEALVSTHDEDATEPVARLLSARSETSSREIRDRLYILRNRDVVRHLFRVASGLDSMIVGEPQISGQVREAFLHAMTLDSLDLTLQRLFEYTLRVAKKVRTETGIGEHAVSVPYAAVELTKKIFGELRDLQVLLIGAGDIGELIALHLTGSGLKKVFVANRAHDRAVELAQRFGGEAVRFDALEDELQRADIVIASTAAPHYVLTATAVTEALARRPRRNLFLIDLAVPRNLDPEIAGVDGAYLYNIDDLREVAETNREKRLAKAELGEQIIERETDAFLRHLATFDAIPTIIELQTRLEQVRRAELEKCLRRMGPISAEQQAAVEALTTSIINKILHYPILRLKESTAEQRREGETIRETILKIFGLR